MRFRAPLQRGPEIRKILPGADFDQLGIRTNETRLAALF
jgi:hypothetical protein